MENLGRLSESYVNLPPFGNIVEYDASDNKDDMIGDLSSNISQHKILNNDGDGRDEVIRLLYRFPYHDGKNNNSSNNKNDEDKNHNVLDEGSSIRNDRTATSTQPIATTIKTALSMIPSSLLADWTNLMMITSESYNPREDYWVRFLVKLRSDVHQMLKEREVNDVDDRQERIQRQRSIDDDQLRQLGKDLMGILSVVFRSDFLGEKKMNINDDRVWQKKVGG